MRYVFAFAVAVAVNIYILVGCANRPTCADNPRNMQCMTADQLEQELSK